MKLLKLFLLFSILGIMSCSDKVEESMIDCLGESFLTNVEHSSSDQNAKLINFNITYSGEQQLNNSVKWVYGDGAQQVVNGKTSSHTYSQSGTFTAIATVKTSGGCTFDVKETVIVK
ncbi:PKD domain-containing protein [Sphingobacterium spiritivorum]|uniref:PKD domain-containing protein n=1 Tax=Sphingobacterium spiritivorum TaxID=258 RepID=UPI001918E6CF|nr:PKD domain-containing protein [Sphingobacterium spiritivorum]QQT25920.1 PKD domain-containing protein [Sphingobacterium spiritivorum]